MNHEPVPTISPTAIIVPTVAPHGPPSIAPTQPAPATTASVSVSPSVLPTTGTDSWAIAGFLSTGLLIVAVGIAVLYFCGRTHRSH
jgi:hypothetical protein